jgi:hypothetical protein
MEPGQLIPQPRGLREYIYKEIADVSFVLLVLIA